MTVFSNIAWLTPLHTVRHIEAVKRDGEAVEAVLTKDWSIAFDWKNDRWRLTVPEGFEAAPSVPMVFRNIVSFWGGGFEASVAHDWCYWTRAFDLFRGFGERGKGRKLADQLYLVLMAASGVSAPMRQRNYLGVRIGGAGPYNRNTRKTDNGLFKIGPALK